MENYIEHLVKGKRGTKEYMERGVAIALPFLFMFILSLFSLPLIFFVFLLPISYYIRIRSDKEYEYLYMAGDLSISVLDFAGLGVNPHYLYLVQKEGKKIAYILDCPEKLIKEMRLYSRDKWL